ncbi:response regulator transcription factor [Fulvivirga lutea]|uniref:Helix-turn-helix transcriptional regulator n=1 Tax=Fulvivirga lutea TaxID=2810512 RepID=A0A974WL08_9BACT|nr:helix-turn-helix transcriptional regulator [Fulvivirga lutea]QSE98135.1 helix-turn-helix transcriptional regulator [Fulvivirga lutea]
MHNHEFVNIYDEVFETIKELKGDVIETHIKRLKELDKLIPPSAMFFCITNTTKRSFEFVSKNFSYATGLDRKKMEDEGMTYWWSRYHPDEASIWLKVLSELMEFTLAEIPQEDRKRVSYIWNYSIKNSKDEYLNVTQHTTPMYFDDEGKPVIGLAHYSVTGSGDRIPMKSTALILNANDEYETIYYKNYSQHLLENKYSHRERDILRLLSLGHSTSEIAKKLFISEHTVHTHRKNILAKTDCQNITELVAKCIRDGLL